MVKFDRQWLQSLLNIGENVKITLTGRLKDGKNIKGEDYIRVIDSVVRGQFPLEHHAG